MILVCYEKDPADCHRTVAANLLHAATMRPVHHLLRPGFTARLI